MKQEIYQQVAFIGLRNPDGSMMPNVPLYVKVNVDADGGGRCGMTAQQEEVIHRISEVMLKRYEKQITEYMAGLKKGESNYAK